MFQHAVIAFPSRDVLAQESDRVTSDHLELFLASAEKARGSIVGEPIVEGKVVCIADLQEIFGRRKGLV